MSKYTYLLIWYMTPSRFHPINALIASICVSRICVNRDVFICAHKYFSIGSRKLNLSWSVIVVLHCNTTYHLYSNGQRVRSSVQLYFSIVLHNSATKQSFLVSHFTRSSHPPKKLQCHSTPSKLIKC